MKYLYILFTFLLFASCSSDNGGGTDEPKVEGFDRKAMLNHWAQDIIIPGYQDLAKKNQNLHQKVKNFVDAPNHNTLNQARASLRNAYLTWQKVAFFEVGPAKNENLRQFFNIYPASTDKVARIVSEQDYNLHLSSNASIQGYPTLDYLLNGLGSDDAIIAKFNMDSEATDYKRFILALSSRLRDKAETVENAWGSYKDTFIQNDGSSATSSIDLVANDYLLFYEKFYRNGKVRFPSGYTSGHASPKHVEAYYSPDLSLELFKTATMAMHDFFQGKSYGSDVKGLGFEAYLNALKRPDIVQDINENYENIFATANGINGTLRDAVVNHRESVLNLQDQIQKNVVPMKVDMLQELNISVAYFDGDGD
ncbi:MAG: imelysin family protein [Weeksellaceae bacterium]